MRPLALATIELYEKKICATENTEKNEQSFLPTSVCSVSSVVLILALNCSPHNQIQRSSKDTVTQQHPAH